VDLTELVVPTPDTWFVIDPDPATRRATAKGDVAARAEGSPHLGPYEEHVVDALLRFGEEASSMGALLAAAFWEPTEGGPVVAELLALEGQRSDPDDLGAEIAALRKTLSRADPSDLGPRDVSETDHPVGRSVRVRWLVDLARAGDGTSSAIRDVTQHWLPLGTGPGAVLLILSVTTTAIQVADDVAAVADLVADNISWARRPA
jgi:hypothetical protein